MELTREIERSLVPGFLVTLAGPNAVRFPLLREARVRRAAHGTVALVAELSGPAHRSLPSVIDDVVRRTGAQPAALLEFVEALGEAHYLLSEPQPPRYAGVDVSAVAALGAVDPAARLRFHTPASLLVDDGAFLWFDHDGVLRARLGADETLAASLFGVPSSAAEVWERHRHARSPLAQNAFDDLVSRMVSGGILSVADAATDEPNRAPNAGPSPRAAIQLAVSAAVTAHDEEQAHRTGDRIQVVPVNTNHDVAPAALGLLVAYALEFDGRRLRDRYDFVPQFLADEKMVVERATRPSIFLFSNYVWNVERNLAISALVKQLDPEHITIHGGPSTPKYEHDAEEFFAQFPHVDITVRGEGEVTFAEILDALDLARTPTLAALADVGGLTFRAANGVVRTPDRARIADLDTIPSPYLMGLMDPFGAARSGVVIETNRGCPYGCTFCDWGSATLSRIRKFSMERVFAELEWCARRKIDIASIADANFGIMERDVAIAQRIADLKREYGVPRTVATNYAKNTVKHLRQIIEIFADVEILTEGVVSLQSMDEPTLKIIRRTNIKLEKYDELADEFRRARLPLAADIMMGLPGSTQQSFRNDLQQCTDRDVRVRANPTQLLPNSPMNDPDYRREHGITAKAGELVTETTSFTRAEWEDMDALRQAYYMFDNWGVLRYVARFVRSEIGLHEVDFYDRVCADALADPHRWPLIATTLRLLEGFMAPPASWGLFIADIRRYLTAELGVASDTALEAALRVQLGHLPAPDRSFPTTLSLAHDFTAWQDELLAARESGHRGDWEHVVPRLCTYPPAEVTISDPNDISHVDIGKHMGALGLALRSWELESPIARPRLGVVTSAA